MKRRKFIASLIALSAGAAAAKATGTLKPEPSNGVPASYYHGLTPSADPEKLSRIVEEEAKTHRHLWPGEPLMDGDIYGGKDWGFIFAIGSPQVQSPKAGEPCPTSAYRHRRKI